MATQCAQKYLTTTYQSWGAKVRAVHIAGSYWAPGFANYLLLLQVFYHTSSRQCKMQATDIFTYNMTHCPGPENTATAASLLDIIVRFSFIFWFGKLRNLLKFEFQPCRESCWWQSNVAGGGRELVNIAIALAENLWRKQLRSWNWFILILYPYLLIFKIVLVFIINILR